MNGPDSPPNLKDVFKDKYSTTMSAYGNNINTNITDTTKLKNAALDSTFVAGTYELLNGNAINGTVNDLMRLSNNLTMTATNSGSNISYTQQYNNNGPIPNTKKYGWYKATWKTCLSDLKSRKFTCTDVIYDTSSESTGRIVEMQFEEL